MLLPFISRERALGVGFRFICGDAVIQQLRHLLQADRSLWLVLTPMAEGLPAGKVQILNNCGGANSLENERECLQGDGGDREIYGRCEQRK